MERLTRIELAWPAWKVAITARQPWPDLTVAARAKPGAPELVHGLLESASSFLVSCCLLHGAAPQWLPIDRTTFVVAEPWFVVSEEHLADKVTPTAHTGLLEDALQVLLHGMGRDEQLVRDLCRGVAAKDQPRNLLLALGQPVRRHEQG